MLDGSSMETHVPDYFVAANQLLSIQNCVSNILFGFISQSLNVPIIYKMTTDDLFYRVHHTDFHSFSTLVLPNLNF